MSNVASTPVEMTDIERPKRHSNIVNVLIRLSENPMAILGLIILIIMILVAIFAPYLSPYKFDKINISESFLKPSLAHPAGTDQLGRDTLARLMYGARYSLQIGIWATLLGTIAGVFLGALAGFFGKAVDEIVMRGCDILQSMPGMILNVAIASALGPGFTNCIIALSVGIVPRAARLIRASILSIREMEYIQAATITNCSTTKTIVKHLIPNALSSSIIQASMSIGGAIRAAAGLAYLGLGVQAPTPEWGAMLSEGRAYIRSYPFMCIFPGVLIVITVLSLNLLGDGLRDALDPKLKK